MRKLVYACLTGLVLVPLLAATAGTMMGKGALTPVRHIFNQDSIRVAEKMQSRSGARREDFTLTLRDGVVLRGWKFRPRDPSPTNDWVLGLHGVSDHRTGVLGHSEFLLRHGYRILVVDMRAHGASGGTEATYGWKERHDVREIADALYSQERPHCLFLLGESMGAAIALQAAAVEPGVAGVVAESSFASLREVSYDYAGLRISPWLGKTLFRPAAVTAMNSLEQAGGFRVDDVSPERSVIERAFPVLLICGLRDKNIPARHTERIFASATGAKEMWLVPGAGHSMALGTAPQEFERRVVTFYSRIHNSR